VLVLAGVAVGYGHTATGAYEEVEPESLSGGVGAGLGEYDALSGDPATSKGNGGRDAWGTGSGFMARLLVSAHDRLDLAFGQGHWRPLVVSG
jgi:hypothetical protein